MQTTGIIELGGASAQVTFVSSEPVPPEFSRAVKFGNVTYNLYSHSFLHFSQNVAYDSLKEGIVSGDFDSVDFAVTSRAWGSTKGYSLVTHL
ncbi:probable apyrase 6 isoform X1 [Malus domestica]|uniref:probable apyrase 6 isoform X1 n=1 Tax=Malus domestica TaxID=3750 RepID=UPI003976A33F